MNKKEFSKLIAKAWSDPKFKEKLLKNPEDILRECKIELPKGAKIEVHENTDKVVHMVIPEKPSGEFAMKELESIAGGCTGAGWTPCT